MEDYNKGPDNHAGPRKPVYVRFKTNAKPLNETQFQTVD